MSKPTSILMIVALALTVAWSSTTAVFNPAAPHDIKNLGVQLFGDDVSAEGLAALDAALPGVGVPCIAGQAGPYGCSNVDLEGLVPLAELGGAAGNDSWGWTAEDGTEIAIMGTGRNVGFVDISDPTNPAVIAQLPTPGGETSQADAAIWRDIKVNNDHAYIVSERGGGMQIVDMNALLAGPTGPTTVIQADATYRGLGSSTGDKFFFDGFHNLVINEETDTAFMVGVDSHNGRGFIIVDIANPTEPQITGRFDHGLTTHDATCVVYRGADTDYSLNYTRGDADGDPSNGNQAELCFTFDEVETNIIDVTVNAEPVEIATIPHIPRNGAGTTGANNGVTGIYSHQGWLTENHSFLLINDELDELNTRVGALTGGTNTYYVELTDLDDIDGDGFYRGADVQTWTHPTSLATDHNMYVKGDLLFQANYAEGVRVLRIDEDAMRAGEGFTEVGFFDVDPGLNAPGFAGTWNVFPFFESGTIIASSLDEGLYTLTFNDPDADDAPAASLLGK